MNDDSPSRDDSDVRSPVVELFVGENDGMMTLSEIGKVRVYRRFHRGELTRKQAKLSIGLDWETISQIASAQLARESNEKNGYSNDELAELV